MILCISLMFSSKVYAELYRIDVFQLRIIIFGIILCSDSFSMTTLVINNHLLLQNYLGSFRLHFWVSFYAFFALSKIAVLLHLPLPQFSQLLLPLLLYHQSRPLKDRHYIHFCLRSKHTICHLCQCQLCASFFCPASVIYVLLQIRSLEDHNTCHNHHLR